MSLAGREEENVTVLNHRSKSWEEQREDDEVPWVLGTSRGGLPSAAFYL